MIHFFDPLHVQILRGEGAVLLAVRVSDDRADEYQIPVEVFREMAVAYHPLPPEWAGPDDLQVRVDTTRRLVSLAVRVGPFKRDFYRIGQSSFEAMLVMFQAHDHEEVV